MAEMLKSWWSGTAMPEDSTKQISSSEEGESSSEQKTEPEVTSTMLGGFVSSVTGYASNLRDTVQSTVKASAVQSLVSDFNEEQKKFEREQQRQKDSAVPPWVGFNEEDQMKEQILRLSADSRNVLRNPPPGVQFHFDFAKSYPVAMSVLKEDSRLQKLRFELVPKKVSEERFWGNYFYRVFLIKQSSQLASLASSEKRDSSSPVGATESGEQSLNEKFISDEHTTETQAHLPEADFASDALVVGEEETISRESVREELGQLGVKPESPRDNVDQWEEELARELEDLGLDEGAGNGAESPDHHDNQWEEELQQMLNSHNT